MTKCNLAGIITALLFLSHSLFAQTQVEFNNTNGACQTRAITPCTSSSNQAHFYATTPTPAPVSPTQPNILPRYKAFWITGDGNYLQFPDTETDQESLNPAQPYNYANAGTYTVSVYLTGKYTNHHPPAGAGRSINVGPAPTAPLGRPNPNQPNTFNRRAGSGDYDFFPIHDIRKNYLTPMVLSYPASLSNTWGYLFFNGHGDGSAWTQKPLVYKKSPGEVANYYSGNPANIRSFPTASLSLGGDAGIDGLVFSSGFQSLQSRYNDVVYFPRETVAASSLPSGFTQKRYFPVFWADTSVVIGERDSLLSFCYIVTSDRPASGEDQERLNSIFRKLDWPLYAKDSINNPLGLFGQSPPTFAVPAQFIQGVYLNTVKYVAAHDPNQLTVEKVEALPNGKYLVTFQLEMCNKGGGRTALQHIDLFDRFGRFRDFKYRNNPVPETAGLPRHYKMESTLEIEGIPDTGYAMMCKSITFTAETDCDGIKSLWSSNAERAFEVCVKFEEAPDTECGDNMPIDSCTFKIDGKCPCVEKKGTCGGDDWLLVFVLLLVFLLLIWKYFSDKANNL